MRTLTVQFLILAPIILCGYFWSNSRGLTSRVDDLEAQVEELSAILEFVHVERGEINGLAGPHWIIEGANVHVRSRSGRTSDSCNSREPNYPNCDSLTGLGNLIIGYNEQRPFRGGTLPHEIRTGSHNLVVGDYHTYSSFGGFVAGSSNKVTNVSASVCGGSTNVSSGFSSSISGGQANVASGANSSVGGGQTRTAPDEFNWAAGSLLELH